MDGFSKIFFPSSGGSSRSPARRVKVLATSVRQPLASMVASGGYDMLPSRWAHSFRGPLVICSSWTYLGDEDLPLRKALCFANMTGVRLMTDEDAEVFGGKHIERFVWELRDVFELEDPFSVVGANGFYRLLLPEKHSCLFSMWCIRSKFNVSDERSDELS